MTSMNDGVPPRHGIGSEHECWNQKFRLHQGLAVPSWVLLRVTELLTVSISLGRGLQRR